MADTITVAFKRPKNGGLLLAQQQSTEAHNCLRAPVFHALVIRSSAQRVEAADKTAPRGRG